MCTSTVAVADALPAQPATATGDSTVERSGICTSLPFVAAQSVGLGDGDGVGVGVGLGDGVGLGVGVGVGSGATVNDCVAGDETFCARSIARVEKVYTPAPSPLYVVGD